MTDITDDLVEAIWREAWSKNLNHDAPKAAIRLALSGWRPVDPDLVLARECALSAHAGDLAPLFADKVRRGARDQWVPVQSALLAIKAVREQMEGN